jgi:hypothetical protein
MPKVFYSRVSLQNSLKAFKQQISVAVRNFTEGWKGFASNRSGSCRPTDNVVLIKVHKCASSSIANILTRYGMKHRLNFALPRFDIGHIGWPKPLRPEHIEPIGKNRQINIIAHHITYNETTLTRIMPSDTKYFAILREPFSHFKSTMFYFRLEAKQFHFKTNDRVSEFLSNPQFYERKIAFYFNNMLFGRRSMTLNFMSTEFGFNNGWCTNDNKIREFMEYVKRKIDLVLIREHMTESVVLMRRLLCWSMEDVISLVVNKQDYSKNAAGIKYSSATEATLRAKYNAWSRVDFMMYEYFNRTLWERIVEQGPDFWSEVEVYSMVNQLVTRYCADKFKKSSFMVPETSWNKKFEFKRAECLTMTKGPHLFNREIGIQMGLSRFKFLNPYARNLLPKHVKP